MVPQLRAWHATYEPAGLTIVGVHSPEFFWEKPYDKVVDATKRLGVRYPVVQDNDFAIGEGDYEETEAMIRRLLAEGS